MSDDPRQERPVRKMNRILEGIARDVQAIRMNLEERQDAHPDDENVRLRGSDSGKVDDRTAALLVRLGWTPPEGQ